MILNIALIVVAYLLGSIPSAVWIGKRFYGIDVREHGSHNAGATNTLRVLGKRAALPVFAIDILKGFAAVMLSHLSAYEAGSPAIFNLKIALVAAAVTGHILPVFAGFKGGKGVATLAGAVLGVYPPAVLLCLATFALVLALTHYVSLSSMTAGVMFPVYIVFVFRESYPPLIIFGCVIAALLIFTHRKNIKRLATGTESKTYLFRRPSEKK
ncbi:MAG: glycerol-3-phosphate 1-O-acyltransferase PlsY [Rikenellaceae bacterium]|nr:glycerol-3-phosphate 1-O-acyltransferase PlsY [Rikenellaceae bacterium]